MTTRGAVAVGSRESAQAGEAMFSLGGNAIDAAIAAAFATAAGDPAICSLAGGGVLLFRDGRSGVVEVCDFFASAPGLSCRRLSASPPGELPPLDFHAVEVDFQTADALQTFHVGRAAAAVPGILGGLCAAQKRWAKLPLGVLVEPAVSFLRQGVRLNDYQVRCNAVLANILELSEFGRERYFRSDGSPLAVGDRFRNPEQADSLEALGRDGLEAFQQDVLFPALLSEFGEDAGGWMTEQDLRSWGPVFREPLRSNYGDGVVMTNPAPSFGGAFVSHTFELFQRVKVAGCPPMSAERFFRLTAVFRAISELRAEIPDIAHRPDAGELLGDRLDQILAGAEPNSTAEGRIPGNTTHVSAVDEYGNAVSMTLSFGEGNGHVIPGTGIFMNNLMGEEDLFPEGFNRFTPGDRLNTMMAPTIIYEKSGALTALGSGGSNRIRTVIPQVVLAMNADRLSPAEAVRRARIHYENGHLSVESYLLDDATHALSRARTLAEDVQEFDAASLFFGGVHLVRRNADCSFDGVGDFRRNGVLAIVEGLGADVLSLSHRSS